MTVHLEASERPGDLDRKALLLDHNTLWNLNRFFPDTTHLANRTKNFAAQIGLTAVLITHYALTRGHNSDAHTAHDTGQIANGGIDPTTRLARSFYFADDRAAIPVILQGNPDYSLVAVVDSVIIEDIALFLEHCRNAFADARSPNFDLLPVYPGGITNSREHISYWITQSHSPASRILYFINCFFQSRLRDLASLFSPTGLSDSRYLSLVSQGSKADATNLELAIYSFGSPTKLAARVLPHAKLRFLCCFVFKRLG
jgi:hypothetical protein